MTAAEVRALCRTVLEEIHEVLASARRLPIPGLVRDVERAMLEPEALYRATLDQSDEFLESIDPDGIATMREVIAEYRTTIAGSHQN